jgi:hypothetical protein
MTIRRYARAPVIGFKSHYGTSFAIIAIRENIKNGNIRYDEMVLEESERLDVLAGRAYGDGSLGWIIAAASNIGNLLQTPPGTRILIPNLEDVSRFLG